MTTAIELKSISVMTTPTFPQSSMPSSSVVTTIAQQNMSDVINVTVENVETQKSMHHHGRGACGICVTITAIVCGILRLFSH